MRIQRRFLLGIGATIVFSTLGGYGISRYQSGGAAPHEHAAQHEAGQHAPAVDQRYVCPMHADVVQDHPGNCPICGMTLVKLASGGTAAHSELLHVDAATQERMGVKFGVAEQTAMHRPIHAFAAIGADESRVVSVNPKVEGWIRRLHVQGVGQPVRKGQVLYELYSPELQQRQRDYVDLLTRRESLLAASSEMMGPNSAMLGTLAKERFRARDRLLAADVPLDVVEALEKSRRIADVIPVRAAQNGVVTVVSAREGAYVNPMQTVVAYADTSKAWAELTVFPDQIDWIRNGDEVVISSSTRKGSSVRARVDLATLQIDAATRTAKLRLPLPNAGGAFQPGSFADAVIKSGARKALSVPRDAVIRTGHGDFVVLNEGGGHFRSAAVVTGMENDHAVEIVSGLSAGNQVAVNGQFLLDAAASMQSMQNRLAGERPAAATPEPAPAHRPDAPHAMSHSS